MKKLLCKLFGHKWKEDKTFSVSNPIILLANGQEILAEINWVKLPKVCCVCGQAQGCEVSINTDGGNLEAIKSVRYCIESETFVG